MATAAYKELEEIHTKIVKLMPDKFDTHQFSESLARKYQKLYVEVMEIKTKNNHLIQFIRQLPRD